MSEERELRCLGCGHLVSLVRVPDRCVHCAPTATWLDYAHLSVVEEKQYGPDRLGHFNCRSWPTVVIFDGQGGGAASCSTTKEETTMETGEKKPLWGVMRPDGTMVDSEPKRDVDAAWLEAARAEAPEKRGGDAWRESPLLGAACWRASCESYTYGALLARELGQALGYRCVEVEVVQANRDVPGWIAAATLAADLLERLYGRAKAARDGARVKVVRVTVSREEAHEAANVLQLVRALRR